MKLNIGDIVRVIVPQNALELTVKVEDASKGDIIQGKVETVADEAKNAAAAFTYGPGKVYEFARKDIKDAA